MSAACIEWNKKRDRRGYGAQWRNGRWQMAHRLAYIDHNGPIPDGMTVDHLCFNPLCVNPAHLRLMTHLENSQNQRSAYKTHCVNGHEYTPKNTYRRRAGSQRDCRTCIRDRVKRYQLRKRQEAAA